MAHQNDCENPPKKANVDQLRKVSHTEEKSKTTSTPLASPGTTGREEKPVRTPSNHHRVFGKIPDEQKDFNNLKRYMRHDRALSKACRLMCCIITLLLVVSFVITIVVLINLFFHNISPTFSVNKMEVHGMNVTSMPLVSPGFDVTLESRNRNSKIGISYYMERSSIGIYHSDLNLCNGIISQMRMRPDKIMQFDMAFNCGEDILLSEADFEAFEREEEKGQVVFGLKLKSPVRLVLGWIKTWKISLRVDCVVTLSGLGFDPKVTSQNCKSKSE